MMYHADTASLSGHNGMIAGVEEDMSAFHPAPYP
jgi:hypothetical protein